ncbi:MAG: SRPBCC family protein [Pseudomonadota bacterium]
MTAVHDKFVLERSYRQSPATVFAALSTEEGKARWFTAPNAEWEQVVRHLDFRVGGTERLVGKWKSGMVTEYDATYQNIVPHERIVYAYHMHIDGKPISVSLACIELHAEGAGTRLVHTEHGIYLDGFEDKGGRAHGIGLHLDKLGETLPG